MNTEEIRSAHSMHRRNDNTKGSCEYSEYEVRFQVLTIALRFSLFLGLLFV
jgi:hypothetical protein